MSKAIRVGVGGWTFEDWRGGAFYPAGLPQAQELHYASRQLSAIEINGTYYSTQKRASFAKWRDDTPDGFVFSLKAHRLATNRRELAGAGDSIAHFVGSGIAELRDKLGPVVWQLAPTKRFDAADTDAFLALLPKEVEGRPLRHVLDVRHDSFKVPQYLDIARRHGVATVFADTDEYPSFADLTADFVYARMMRSQADRPNGYDDAAIDAIAECARSWAAGGEPQAPRIAPALPAGAPRDVFLYFISGAKQRNPRAAQALIAALRR
jgi:uncharacterized protein YecE (DUF72 family)